MARDRQRAKQRRRRSGAARPATGQPRSRARDAADQETSTVFPQRGDVQPVEPEESLESDELAEGVYADEVEPDEVEPAADELDPAVSEERVPERAGRKPRGKILTFLGHVIDELRRVQWPDRRHVGQGTAVVLGFVVLAGGYLGLMDAIWKPLIEAIL
jgi:preprotein translocase SecE subunit